MSSDLLLAFFIYVHMLVSAADGALTRAAHMNQNSEHELVGCARFVWKMITFVDLSHSTGSDNPD